MPDTSAAVAERQKPDLAERWQRFREQNPKTRIRDAAAELGVSEAALVATGCGQTAARLNPDWDVLLKSLPSLGQVMVLTRNDHCVHERHGTFRDVSVTGQMGLVLGDEIDLRIFLRQWKHGFAVTEAAHGKERRSLQIFDASGGAVHKVYMTPSSDDGSYDALVTRFRNPDQTPAVETVPVSAPTVSRPDSVIDVAGLQSAWRALKDTHDFHAMLGKYGVARTQALRLSGPDFAVPVATIAARTTLEAAAATGTPIMVFVGNPGCIQIHTGPVRNLKTAGPWFNVLDPEFNLHLREDRIDTAWIVRKPTTDGVVTSLEIYDRDGGTIAQFFGKRKPGQPEAEDWRTLTADIEKAARV